MGASETQVRPPGGGPVANAARVVARLATALVTGVPLLLLAMLPLTSVVLALPAVAPDENVLAPPRPKGETRLRRGARRLFALLAGGVALVALLAAATEALVWMRLPAETYYGQLAADLLPGWLVNRLPPCLVQHWPAALILVYVLDLILLAAMGRVPFRYNFRNLLVRWRNSLLTVAAFAVVVALLVAMLALVNGMYRLTEGSGHPANVIVLSEGATDELFSNLGGGDVGHGQYEVVTLDEDDRPLDTPVVVSWFARGGEKVRLYSPETYLVASQPVAVGPGEAPQWRFVQVRCVADPEVAGLVHGMALRDGGRWFAGVTGAEGGQSHIQAVLGDGIARQFGADVGKASLAEGDRFELAGRTWHVTGVLKSEGSTFSSEIWADAGYVRKLFHKDVWTSVVYRVYPETPENARRAAYHVRMRYRDKVHAQPETEYYATLAQANRQLLFAIMFVAAVTAVGGVFGIMNTMFAAIAQRTPDIAVLRVLGFRRWQVLVSLVLESVGLALVGGLVGCAVASLVDGSSMMSMVSSGGISGKTVMVLLTVDPAILTIGLLFALTLGRIGGLIPALSSMRLSILKAI